MKKEKVSLTTSEKEHFLHLEITYPPIRKLAWSSNRYTLLLNKNPSRGRRKWKTILLGKLIANLTKRMCCSNISQYSTCTGIKKKTEENNKFTVEETSRRFNYYITPAVALQTISLQKSFVKYRIENNKYCP